MLLTAAAAAVLALPAAAAAGPGLLLGIDDDMGKWAGNSPVAGAMADLGATVQRITVIWLPGESDISGIEAANVQGAIDRAPNARTVLAVYGRRPADAHARRSRWVSGPRPRALAPKVCPRPSSRSNISAPTR